ncbi:hypothetical protein OG216_00245 [Streptomycetaceae bacterium NBC_01309]
MKNLQPAARRVWRAFEDPLRGGGLELLDVLLTDSAAGDAAPGDVPGGPSAQELRDVALGLLKLDESVIAWQQVHQRLVWGRLGGHPVVRRGGAADWPRLPTSLTGRPVDLLDRFARRVLFPALWRGVDQVYARTAVPVPAVCPVRAGAAADSVKAMT